MRFFAALEAFLILVTRLMDAWQRAKKREAERDLQNDVEDIKRDPVDYAQREYGGLPVDAEKADGVSGDKANGAEIRKDG